MSRLAADDPSDHAEFGVIDILVSGKPPEHRLPQHSDRPFLPVRASARLSPAKSERPSASSSSR